MSQKIENIKVKDLVLWTENPRDPISENSLDSDVIKHAVEDPKNKWDLQKLARAMGNYYDFSELPIVVYKGGKPVVYDGNRRVVLAKIKLGFVTVPGFTMQLPDVPLELPCNVCSEDIALQSVYRKHVLLANTWGALERDMFAHKYLHEDKSTFLMFDEATGGFITKNPEMNQGFVRKEVLTDSLLNDMGFSFNDGQMFTKHTDDEVRVLLDNLLDKIKTKAISTRGENRGKPINVLDQRVKDIISSNKDNTPRLYSAPQKAITTVASETAQEKKDVRKTRITRSTKLPLFGEKLILQPGNVNNLYSDILALYNLLSSEKQAFSACVYAIFRMSLRLLCETASKDLGYNDIKDYINKYFPIAKKKLNQDTTTLLASQNVKGETLPQLFHTGAHNYLSSTSQDQAMCISIALGAMLKESHGRK
ncbi:MAG: hypothetical protein KBT27_04655 [Prevotellaceae bacterium]|nr:hypothetical protein [Candidatus Faecinaster equi]